MIQILIRDKRDNFVASVYFWRANITHGAIIAASASAGKRSENTKSIQFSIVPSHDTWSNIIAEKIITKKESAIRRTLITVAIISRTFARERDMVLIHIKKIKYLLGLYQKPYEMQYYICPLSDKRCVYLWLFMMDKKI